MSYSQSISDISSEYKTLSPFCWQGGPRTSHLHVLRQRSVVSGCLTQPCRAQWGLAGLLPLREHLREKGTGGGKPRATRKNDSLKFKKKKSRKGEEDKTSLNTIGNYSHEKGLQWALSIHPLARWAHVLESCGKERPGRG